MFVMKHRSSYTLSHLCSCELYVAVPRNMLPVFDSKDICCQPNAISIRFALSVENRVFSNDIIDLISRSSAFEFSLSLVYFLSVL